MTRWPNCAIIAIFLAAAVAVSGCARRSDPPVPPPGAADTPGDTSPPARGPTLTPEGEGDGGIWVWRDPDTGCEYVVLYSNSITPRMEDKGGKSGLPNPQKGCKYNDDKE